MKYTRLGDLLIDAGVINQEQLERTLKRQKETKQRLGETLISDGIITERQLIDALTMQLGVDFVDLASVNIDPAMAQLVPKNLAKKHAVVPVRTQGDELYLAMADPLNFIATEEVKAASRKRVVPMISTKEAVDHAISALYGAEGAKRAIEQMQQETAAVESKEYVVGVQTATELDATSQAAPSIRLVDTIIERGITDRASDIHIEPREDDMRVRMRIDRLLHDEMSIPKELQSSVISRIKIMCGMDVTERRVPQDGRAIVRVRMKEVDVRASTLPTVHGEKIVLRLLDKDNQLETAEGLGFAGSNLEKYYDLLRNRQGAILLVGPTGSGKSSTMFAMLSHLNTESVNIVTLEDPVEYNLAGVNQVQVNEKAGTTFATGLRSIMRQDPDIVAVGEIRDSETADIAMRAAITGHLVLSTMHTGDALSTLDRLDDIGVEPFMVANALRGVISQRLVRRICPHCKKDYEPTAEELSRMGIDSAEGVRFYHGEGCSECYGSGYRGRIAVAEVLVVTDAICQALHARQFDHEVSATNLAKAVAESGFRPIMANCRELVLEGITTVEEVMRTIYATD